MRPRLSTKRLSASPRLSPIPNRHPHLDRPHHRLPLRRHQTHNHCRMLAHWPLTAMPGLLCLRPGLHPHACPTSLPRISTPILTVTGTTTTFITALRHWQGTLAVTASVKGRGTASGVCVCVCVRFAMSCSPLRHLHLGRAPGILQCPRRLPRHPCFPDDALTQRSRA
jgi:hypothetical protein